MTPNPGHRDPETTPVPVRLNVRIDPAAVARITDAMTQLTDTMTLFVQQVRDTERALSVTLQQWTPNDPVTPPATSGDHPGYGVTSDPPHDPLTWGQAWGHTTPPTTPTSDTDDPRPHAPKGPGATP